MTSFTKWMISLVVIMLGITTIVIWLIQDRFFNTEEISFQQATEKVEALYNGAIERIEEKNNIFHMTIKKNDALYELQLDSKTGEVIQLVKASVESNVKTTGEMKTKEEIRAQLENKNNGKLQSIHYQNNNGQSTYIVELIENNISKTLTIDAFSGEVLLEQVKNPSSVETTEETIISEEKAKELALNQMKGTVSHIVFEKTEDGGYFLVEIKGQDIKSTFQIHGISGNIISVTKSYEDDDDDDDDDEDDDD